MENISTNTNTNENEFRELWSSYNKKLNESLTLNRKNTEDLTKIRIGSFLASMSPLKIFTILAGIIWSVIGDVIVINLLNTASPFFLISAGIQLVLTQIAIVIYIYQLVIIHRVDINQPVMETQRTLARLRTSTLWVARILFLQLPVWTTFYLSAEMFENGNVMLLSLQIVVTHVFTFAAVWLFTNIKFENRNKKWFRLIFDGKEWTPVMRSMELLEQIGEYGIEKEAEGKGV
ncbi:MAG: hypothetical protein SGI89_05745 [bacterium]|nr:hypothetical protein [bacterium]